MKALHLRMIIISFLILFALSCEDMVWNNPNDPNTTLDPSLWAPRNLQAHVLSDSQIKLTWIQDEKLIEGFRIERKEDDSDWVQVGEVEADITQYTDTDLSVEIEFTYRVSAFTESNQSGYVVSNTTSTSFPAPTNLSATALNDTDILLEWDDNCVFEGGFRIERMEDSGSWEQVADLAANVTQYTDTGLSYGPTYTYGVYSYTDNNQSGYAVSNTTSTSFPAPTNLTATPQNDTDILLEWTDNCSFEDGFLIERQSNGGTWTLVGEVAANITQYTDTGLIYGANYTYQIYAFTTSNQSSYVPSNEASTSIAPPTNLTATVLNDTDIFLTWVDNCSFEDGFLIERQSNGGTWTLVGEVAANITQYTDTGLTYGANYFYRVYAFTTSYQSEFSEIAELYLTLTDIDGNAYQTIKIGNQWWMAENLKVTHYRNAEAILNVTDDSEWSNLSTGAYCNYDNDVNNAATYGSLYNWHAVNDSRNIAPEGWHVPSDEEWKELEMHLGMSQSEADSTGWRGTNEGGKLKETGTEHWNSSNIGATNESGFTALPGGYRYIFGNFNNSIGDIAGFWSSTESSSGYVWNRYLMASSSGVSRNYSQEQHGFSVRCVRD